MKRLLSRLPLFVVVVWMVACTSETDIFLPYDASDDLPEDLADAPIDQLLLDGREGFTYLRTFPIEEAYRFQLPGSIGIHFPAGEWATTSGEIVEGLVTARIVAARSPAELLLSNVSSLADDQLLSMLGAVRIELFKAGRPLHPTGNNYSLELDFPISSVGELWQLYLADQATHNWQVLADVSPVSISVKDYETGDPLPALRFQVPWTGWVALARDFQAEYSTLTQLNVRIPQSWTANWASVFAIVPSESSVLRLRAVTDTGLSFQTDLIPADQDIQLIGLGRDEMGQIYFGFLETQTTTDLTDVHLELMQINESALSGLLGL